MCSFFRSWKGADGPGEDPIARRVSSIDKAFHDKTMSPLEELEYACLTSGCRLYVVFTDSSTGEVQTGCFMPLRSAKTMTYRHTILVAADANDPMSVDYISNVSRTTTAPAFNADITYASYDAALRIKLTSLVSKLEEARVSVCTSEIPSIEDAFALAKKERGELPRATNFISGPSRTGDIEQTIVLGAHGPYRVHVILVRDI
jgi:hypothetical protein